MEKRHLKKIEKIISRFAKARILVLGDLILDEFVWGTVSRISPEAPVPVVWVNKESYMPGGSCNVANNIVSLGGKSLIVGVVGDDDKGVILKEDLESKGIDTSGVSVDTDRKTILKTRVVAHHQQVVRIDKENAEPLSERLQERMISEVKKNIADADALVIEDYGKGVITPRLLREVVPFARRLGKIVAVDPKEEHFSYYKGVSLITPNTAETEKASGLEIKDEGSLFKAGKKLLAKLKCGILLVTLGESGMCVFTKGSRPKQIPTIAQEVFDVSGAGDTVIAAYTLALASGADPIQAAHIANCAAGIVVGKLGTATVSPEELLKSIRDVAKTKKG